MLLVSVVAWFCGLNLDNLNWTAWTSFVSQKIVEVEYLENHNFSVAPLKGSWAKTGNVSFSVSQLELAADRPWDFPEMVLTDYEYLRERIAEEYDWSFEYSIKAIGEYVRFLVLIAESPHLELIASTHVDMVWHEHMLETQMYEADCHRMFGFFLHHYRARSPDEIDEIPNAYILTRRVYRLRFGIDPPPDTWGSTTGASSMCGAIGADPVNRGIKDATWKAEIDGPVVQETARTDSGTIVIGVKKVSKEKLKEGTRIEVQDTAVKLPGEIANAAPGETTVITVVEHRSPGYLNDGNADMQGKEGSAPVLIEVLAQNTMGRDSGQYGIVVPVNNLKEPAEINISVTQRKPPEAAKGKGWELKCVYWDEVQRRWSSDGLTGGTKGENIAETGLMPASVACTSQHLSSFALVYAEFEMAVLCSNLAVFTRDSWEKVLEGSWSSHLAGSLVWLLVVLTWSTMLLAAFSDFQSTRHHRWNDEGFLLDADALPVEKEKVPIKDKIGHAALLFVVHANIAAKAGIHKQDLNIAVGKYMVHEKKHALQRGQSEANVQAKNKDVLAAEHMNEQSIRNHLDATVQSSFGSRFKVLFVSIHPVLALLSYSIVVPHKLRALMYCNKVWAGLFVSALFFSVSGDSVSIEEPEQCAKKGLPYGRAVAVGIISSLISSGFAFVLVHLHSRQFVYAKNWDEKKRKKLLMKWKVMDMLLGVLGLFFAIFCMVYVSMFLATITTRDRTIFATTVLTSLLKSLIIMPIIISLVLSGIAGKIKKGDKNYKEVEELLALENAQQAEQKKEISVEAQPTSPPPKKLGTGTTASIPEKQNPSNEKTADEAPKGFFAPCSTLICCTPSTQI